MTDQNLGDQGAGPVDGQGASDAGQGGQASASQNISAGDSGDKATPSKLDVLMEFVPEEDRQYIKSEDDYKKYQAHMRDNTLKMYEIERQTKAQKATDAAPSKATDPLAEIEDILIEENKRDQQRVKDGELSPEKAFARAQLRSADMARRMAQADMSTRDKQRDEKQGKLLEFERTSGLPRSIRAQVAFLIDQQNWPVEMAERFGRDMVESLKSEGYKEPDRSQEPSRRDATGRYARNFVEPPAGGASGSLYGSDSAIKDIEKAISNLKPGQSPFDDIPWSKLGIKGEA
jgi:hypothetical protein